MKSLTESINESIGRVEKDQYFQKLVDLFKAELPKAHEIKIDQKKHYLEFDGVSEEEITEFVTNTLQGKVYPDGFGDVRKYSAANWGPEVRAAGVRGASVWIDYHRKNNSVIITLN